MNAALVLSLFLALLSACAGPQLQVPRASPQGIDIERQRQLGLIQDKADVDFRLRVEEWRRVYSVYSRLRTAGAELCKNDVKPFWGMWLADQSLFPPEDRDRARRFLGIDQKVLLLAAAGPAANAGLRQGDVVTRINGVALEPQSWSSQGSYLQRATEALAKADMRSVEVEISRSDTKYSAIVTPEAGCRYQLNIRPDAELNAFATGDAIAIFSGILSLANNDDELAHVIGHELAHNALGHPGRRESNRGVGGILGAVVDIGLLLGTGINTSGVFTQLGADAGRKAYSQDFEREADYTSLYFMTRSGFDPTKAADVQRKLGVVEPGSLYSNYSSTHPSTAERAANLDIALHEVAGKIARSESLLPTKLENSITQESTVVVNAPTQPGTPPTTISTLRPPPATVTSLPTSPPVIVSRSPEQKPITKTYASLVQYDGPKIKSGVTLDAQFMDDGSGSGEGLVNDIGNHMLKGTFTTIKPGARDWPKPKILDRATLNKLQILSDRPWVIATFSNADTVLECVYGETRPLGQKKGACRDNYGNRYHVNLLP